MLRDEDMSVAPTESVKSRRVIYRQTELRYEDW